MGRGGEGKTRSTGGARQEGKTRSIGGAKWEGPKKGLADRFGMLLDRKGGWLDGIGTLLDKGGGCAKLGKWGPTQWRRVPNGDLWRPDKMGGYLNRKDARDDN